jgi:hypothetical protein
MKIQGGQIMEIRKAQSRIGPQQVSKNPEKKEKNGRFLGLNRPFRGKKRPLGNIGFICN